MMGLDVNLGWLERIEFDYLIKEVLRENHLADSESLLDDPSPSVCDDLGLSYCFRDIGEYCGSQNLPYIHMPKITCSRYQFILPIDFSDPLPVFASKQLNYYEQNYSVPTNEDMSEEELRDIWRRHSYPYYNNTPLKDVYMLSSQRLLAEIDDLIAPYISHLNEWGVDGFDILLSAEEYFRVVPTVAHRHPHRPGRADFPHPVPHHQGSLHSRVYNAWWWKWVSL